MRRKIDACMWSVSPLVVLSATSTRAAQIGARKRPTIAFISRLGGDEGDTGDIGDEEASSIFIMDALVLKHTSSDWSNKVRSGSAIDSSLPVCASEAPDASTCCPL